MNTRTASWSLLTVAIAISATWLITRAGSNAFHDTDYRKTSGLSINELLWKTDGDGYRVSGVLSNTTRQSASSVVLVVEAWDNDRRLIAMNPLITVLSVPGGDRRPFEAFVAAPGGLAKVRVEARVALVRWDE